jgi:hypothetical protein
METKPTLTLDQPAAYRLRLQGRVSADWSDWLTNTAVNFEGDQTVVTGVVRDQAALFGLLSFVRDLGVPLCLVEFLPNEKENEMNKNLLDTIFKAVALGMGVAVITLNTLGSLSVDTAVTMLSIGLTALALAGLQKS